MTKSAHVTRWDFRDTPSTQQNRACRELADSISSFTLSLTLPCTASGFSFPSLQQTSGEASHPITAWSREEVGKQRPWSPHHSPCSVSSSLGERPSARALLRGRDPVDSEACGHPAREQMLWVRGQSSEIPTAPATMCGGRWGRPSRSKLD